MDKVECVVIGAGVVGLACARALARQGMEVIILDQHAAFGTETSSRNSEVIHAGIYYPPGSNKAKWCVEGKRALYDYCIENNIPHQRLGKLIIATQEHEIATLQDIKKRALANGVDDLFILTANQVKDLEPEVAALAGIFSPSTGIIDSHQYMLALLGDAQASGAMLALNSKLISGVQEEDHVILQIIADGAHMQLETKLVINAAGLHASKVARSIVGIQSDEVPETYYRKGDYFTYAGVSPFKHLIYPVPVPGGLGIHSTLDMAGQVKFGPDVELIDELAYTVDPNKREIFAKSIQRYWPSINPNLLQAGYAGVRPALAHKAGEFKDFVVTSHDRVVGLYGIESPGLTASLALADAVVKVAMVCTV